MPVSSRTSALRSRPLPVLPGGAMAPRVQSMVSPVQNHSTGEPQRVSSLAQPAYVDTQTYMPQLTSHPYASNYANSSLSAASYTAPQSNVSDYAGGYANQNAADQYSAPSTYSTYDEKHANNQQQIYSGYPSQNPEPVAYPYRVSSAGAMYGDQNGQYAGYAAPRSSVQTNETMSSSLSGEVDQRPSYYSDKSQISHDVDPSSAVHSSVPYQQLPPPSSGEDFHIDVGNLLRSDSTSSSFASAGSLLQEPKHSPTVEHNILTPTSARQPTFYGSSTTTQQTSNSYANQNLYSPTSGYGTPAIVTTPAEAVSGSSRRTRAQEYDRLASMKGPLELHEEDEDEDEELEEDRFVNLSLLSHLANRLRDRVPRGTHVKGSIPYPMAFTGKDIVVCYLHQAHHSLNSSIVVHYSSPSAERIPK
jgi:hypothetical protein